MVAVAAVYYAATEIHQLASAVSGRLAQHLVPDRARAGYALTFGPAAF